VAGTVTAARLVEHGVPLHVASVPLADAGPDDVVVNLAYAGVNPVDRYLALGQVAPDGPRPRTLGTEGAGTTTDGRRVVVHGHGLGTSRDGTWAGAVVAPRSSLVEIPEGIDLGVAATVGVAGVTGWRVVTTVAAARPDDRALVLGAAGGVGGVIVSALHHLGATVWGQTGDETRADWIRSHGADEVVVVPRADGLVEAIKTLQPTVVFDPLGDGYSGAAIEALSPRGRLVLFGTSAGTTGELPLQRLFRKSVTVRGYGGLIEPPEVLNAAIAETLAALVAGRVQITVSDVVPLADVNDALARIEHRRVLGNLVLDTGPAAGG
jgi:NADPH:quinone reductase